MDNETEINFRFSQLLVRINQLQIKAFKAPSREALGFIIVNDTFQVFKYDQALLWEYSDNEAHLIAVSGQHKIIKETEFYQKSHQLFKSLTNPKKAQEITPESFSKDGELFRDIFPKVTTFLYWFPIIIENELRLGLLLELFNETDEKKEVHEVELQVLSNLLIPSYSAAWAKFDQARVMRALTYQKKIWYSLVAGLLLASVVVRVPLRVVSPAEIVPETPILVTAPLDGTIANVLVKPGMTVSKDELLFEYDKRVPIEELKTAQKQVEISEAEVNRSATLGLSDQKALAELEILKLKLQKDQVILENAQLQAEKLDVKAPEGGVVMIDDPEEWRGRPVRIGERVLTISDPSKTKIKIWIPESDNVIIDPQKDVKLYLNVSPDHAYYAKLDYISFESRIGEGEVPGFLAEALWENQPKDVKLGLKGTAILYGENVSLLYFLFRKPWASFRRYTGL